MIVKLVKILYNTLALADMAELADALVSGSSGETHAGSSPVIRTVKPSCKAFFVHIISLKKILKIYYKQSDYNNNVRLLYNVVSSESLLPAVRSGQYDRCILFI